MILHIASSLELKRKSDELYISAMMECKILYMYIYFYTLSKLLSGLSFSSFSLKASYHLKTNGMMAETTSVK